MDNDSDSVGTLTSSDCSDADNPSDGDESSEATLSDHEDNCSDDDDDDDDDDDGTESYRSLTFSVQSNRSTATVKSNKTKKRVRFKPGDKLVLVYIIPNREMLGLKSDSEDSEDSDDDDGDDSDDEDDTDEESEEDDDDEEDEEVENEKKPSDKKPKPFARLMAIKQVTKHKKSEKKPENKPARDKTPKLIDLKITSAQKPPKRNNRANRRREKKERVKPIKKENNIPETKLKQGKSKRNRVTAINVDFDKTKRSRRNRPGILEIKATVNKHGTTASVPKLVYKNDLKPSVVNVNGALTVCQTKLLQRSKLQPVSLKVSKDDNSRPSSGTYGQPNRQASVGHAMSTNYESLTSLLPDSYNGFRHRLAADSLRTLSKEEQETNDLIKRLNPDSMNDSSKRHYAWQVANGNISSQSLRTPSILPFWDSLKGSVPENTIKLPT